MGNFTFGKLESDSPNEKYAFVRQLLDTGKQNPGELYPYFSRIIGLLESENNILLWAGIELLGRLATVDTDRKILPYIPALYSFLNTGKMITANHAVASLLRIAAVEPEFQEEIIGEVLKTQEYRYDTEECKNIVYGCIIKGMEEYYPKLKNGKAKESVLEFVRGQRENSRNATKKKAEKFLKKYGNPAGF